MDTYFGDIYLNNKPYRIDFQSWRGKDVIDFAPRATVPGGSFVMSDLGIYQPLVQTDWRHGFGFHWYSDAMGYLQTVGNIDTRQDGIAMLFTKAAVSDTDHGIKRGMIVFGGNVYTWGSSGLRKFNGSAWSSIYSTNPVNFALAAGDYLFFCPLGARIQKMTVLDVVTDAGLDTNAIDYKWLIIHNGYIYAGKNNSNAIHFDSSETLATLQGNSSDTNRIMVGLGTSPTLGAIVYNGNLYVRKTDGVWLIGEDRIARRMLDFSAEDSPLNLASWAVINGYIILPLRDRVLQWNGARVSDITPHKITDTFPYVTYGQFNNFVPVGDFLYCTARTNETTYDESLLCFDGVGWHKLTDLITDSIADTVTMLAYEAVNNRLWYHAAVGIKDDTDAGWTYTGTWTAGRGDGYYNQTTHVTGTPTDYAEYTFTGTQFILVFAKHPNRGTINISIDGGAPISVSANATTLQWQQVYTSAVLANASHTIRFTHAGAVGTYIDLDALFVMGGTASTNNGTYYIPFQNRSTFPYASFPTTGQHSLISSRIDAGFRRVPKSMANLMLEVSNCNTTSYLSIYYALDGGSWIKWADVKSSGVVNLSNPGGATTREFNWIQFRIDFVTTSAAQSPILEGMTMRFIMRPLTKMGYNFSIIAANQYQYGMYEDERNPQEIYNELMEFRNSIAPITLTDMFGVTHYGYVTAIQEQPIYRNPENEQPFLELRYQMNWVDV